MVADEGTGGGEQAADVSEFASRKVAETEAARLIENGNKNAGSALMAQYEQAIAALTQELQTHSERNDEDILSVVTDNESFSLLIGGNSTGDRSPPTAFQSSLRAALSTDLTSLRTQTKIIQAGQTSPSQSTGSHVWQTALSTIRAWTESRTTVEKKAQKLVELIPAIPALIRNDLARMPNKVRLENFLDRIDRYFQFMQISRVEFTPSEIIAILNSPTITNKEDIVGIAYHITNSEGVVVQRGTIKEGIDITLPASEGYSLVTSKFTIAGSDVLALFPKYRTLSLLEKMMLSNIFLMSVSLFSLGFLTQIWTLIESAVAFNFPELETHTSIYWALRDTFGTGMANAVLGQFRDLLHYQ